jgi:hypothetical protein
MLDVTFFFAFVSRPDLLRLVPQLYFKHAKAYLQWEIRLWVQRSAIRVWNWRMLPVFKVVSCLLRPRDQQSSVQAIFWRQLVVQWVLTVSICRKVGGRTLTLERGCGELVLP